MWRKPNVGWCFEKKDRLNTYTGLLKEVRYLNPKKDDYAAYISLKIIIIGPTNMKQNLTLSSN